MFKNGKGWLFGRSLYRKRLKSWNVARRLRKFFCLERATIVQVQGASEDKNFAAKPTLPNSTFLSVFSIIFLFVFLGVISLSAQEAPTMPAQTLQAAADASAAMPAPTLVEQLTVITLLGILPFAVMLLTSYIKIVVVLSLLRNALGVQQSPPNQVLNGIALLMTIYIMFPTVNTMYKTANAYLSTQPSSEFFSPANVQNMLTLLDKTKEPLRDFLTRNTIGKHMTSFYQLATRSFPDEIRQTLTPTDFIVLIPAFITSQLKAAFEIGVLVYLPFFVIDLVTSNILLAMGMMMLSPLTIALPLKLLLLVMVDGWTLIIQGLVLSFR